MKKLLACFFLVLFVIPAFSQKVKYKDIYELLSTKQYNLAEPFLRKYVQENNDNPNAFLFMGFIYEEKIGKDDVLKETEASIRHLDSAIYFFDKAYKTIDEKELRRNKEYYVMYNRRDLRTGDFGVKLSDVQYDLEKKNESLRERIDKIKMVKYYFVRSATLYQRSNELFLSVQKSYNNERELCLRADENCIKDLQTLSLRFDSCTKAFDNYKISAGNLEKFTYNQTWNSTEIKDFKTDGISLANFYKADLQIWDYKKFSDKILNITTKELKPILENLVRYDIEMNKLREKLSTDSVSVENDLSAIVRSFRQDNIKKFDPQPLPLDVFEVKAAELEYKSKVVSYIKGQGLEDINVRLTHVNGQLKTLHKLDSVTQILMGRNIDEEAKNYQHFIKDTYNSTSLLKSFIRAVKENTELEKRSKSEEYTRVSTAFNWLVNGQDSIPLIASANSSFKPLIVLQNKYTAGIKFNDTTAGEGYFYSITPSRIPDIKVSFPIDKINLRASRLPDIKAQSVSDPGGQIFFVMMYLEGKVQEKFPVTIAKIYRSDGLSWSNNYSLDFMPQEIQFNTDTGELLVKSGAQNILIDKSGGIKQSAN